MVAESPYMYTERYQTKTFTIKGTNLEAIEVGVVLEEVLEPVGHDAERNVRESVDVVHAHSEALHRVICSRTHRHAERKLNTMFGVAHAEAHTELQGAIVSVQTGPAVHIHRHVDLIRSKHFENINICSTIHGEARMLLPVHSLPTHTAMARYSTTSWSRVHANTGMRG